MRLKLLAIFSALVLLGCTANKPPQNTYKPAGNPEPDMHKAALLNVEMGDGYLAQGQITRAKSKFIHALELDPKLPQAHSSIGFFYESVGDNEEAEKHHKNAIYYANNKGEFYNNYGTFLCRQARYKEADKAFNNAINDKKYINTAEAFENAGICAIKQEDLSKAEKYLQTAVRRDPRRAESYLELADISYSKGNYNIAKDYLDNYKFLHKANERSLWLSIRINDKLSNKSALSQDAQQLKKLFPNSKQYKSYLKFYQKGSK